MSDDPIRDAVGDLATAIAVTDQRSRIDLGASLMRLVAALRDPEIALCAVPKDEGPDGLRALAEQMEQGSRTLRFPVPPDPNPPKEAA